MFLLFLPMNTMMRTRLFSVVILAFVSLAVGPRAGATTLLTSGVPVPFGLPAATERPILMNGRIGYAIYVPPGAQRLTIRYDMVTPGQTMQVLVRYGADIGLSGLGNTVKDYVLTELTGLGVQELIVHGQSSPPLRSGGCRGS